MPQRILIVDDDRSTLFALREYFTSRDFAVDCAQDVQEAKALLAVNRYPVFMTDLRLTGMDDTQGFDLVAYARDRSPTIRTILLTGHWSPQIEREARQRGVDVCLHKPKPLPEVEQIVCELLNARKKSRQA